MSSYFQDKDEIGIHLQAWERCLKKLQKKDFVCGDVNAKSVLWHSKNCDVNGEELEAFIEAWNF